MKRSAWNAPEEEKVKPCVEYNVTHAMITEEVIFIFVAIVAEPGCTVVGSTSILFLGLVSLSILTEYQSHEYQFVLLWAVLQ